MTSVEAGISAAVTGHRLLDHPFYRRWTAGTLGIDELRDYAAQYRHIERAQPEWLSGIAERLEDEHARAEVTRVLDDELDAAGTHADLFDQFAGAIGAPEDVSPSPATRALIDTLDELVARGPASGLSGLLAYELQSSDVSREKAAGLRAHFGLDADGTAFWDTHAELDTRHSSWLLQALERIGEPEAGAGTAAASAAAAWWAFLDEREAGGC